MRYSQLFGKTQKEAPKDAEAVSHKLLTRGGFVDQLTSGVYSYLPLGWRVYQKIENIIREEMNNIGGQEVFLPALQPKEIWQRSDRWEHMDPPLFKLKDRHDRELALGPTHEEVMTELARTRVQSYKDLPFALYQIQDKFRNEMRSTGGLLRVREFIMKDLYSFHATQEDLDEHYGKVRQAYKNIFERCGFIAKITEADTGSIGGNESHEYMMLCETGEDTISYCTKCDYATSKESPKSCPKCSCEMEEGKAIEAGHIFKLQTKYSEKMGAYFLDAEGNKKPIVMGCYGIGLGRLMAVVVEAHHDEKGILWPKNIAPFDAHLLVLGDSEQVTVKAQEVYEELGKAGIEVLFDDRDVSAGEKFNDADLLGIPVRLVISGKTGEKIEYKERDKEETKLLSISEIITKIS